jgi:phage tail sheath protein FI
MPFYSSPGIYVEEVPSGARPIGAVGTSTAGFVGTAPDPTARAGEAVAVNSWSDFLRAFGGDRPASTPLSRAVYGFFDNGGGRCYVVNVGVGEPIAGGSRRRSGLDLLEAVDEVAIVAAPGYCDAMSYEALLSHCERLGDRVAILDPPEDVDDIDRLTRVATVAPPKKTSSLPDSAPAPASAPAPVSVAQPPAESPGLRPRQSDYGCLYFPWIVVRDPLSGEPVATPPSGHMAGIWARTDSLRGVHKAPANEPVRGVVDLSYRVTRAEQDVLNPKGVNCIRYFAAEGVRVWGARTLAAEASEWRYLNVRRLFNMLKESIADGTGWIVFEPNDGLLWRSIRRDINAFLTRVWRDGALLGRTPQEAFFVKCDEETNPPEVRDAGQVVALIGVAPVKPAEFVVFKLSQSVVGADTESMGG